MSHHGNIIMIDVHCCISTRLGWAQWKLIPVRMECGPVTCHVLHVTCYEPGRTECDRDRVRTDTIYHGFLHHHHLEVFIDIFSMKFSLEPLSRGPDLPRIRLWYRGWILTILIATIIRLIINYPPPHSESTSSFTPDTQFPNSILWAGLQFRAARLGMRPLWMVTQHCTVGNTDTNDV